MTQETHLLSWRFTRYESVEDPRIQKDIANVREQIKNFRERFRGNIAELNKAKLAEMLDAYCDTQEAFGAIAMFAYLRQAQNMKDDAANRLVEQIDQADTEFEADLAFFEAELSQLGAGQLNELSESEKLHNYRNFLVKMAQAAPHVLSEKEEQLATTLNADGRSALVDLFEREGARSEFPFREKKDDEEEQLSQGEILKLLRGPNREIRRRAANTFTEGVKRRAWRQGFLYNKLISGRRKEYDYRRWEDVEAPRHAANQLTQKEVDALAGAVTSRYDVVARYYNLKREYLGLSELYDYDRYAPLSTDEAEISFSEARQIVLGAFDEFSPRFREIAEKFFAEGWIDADPRKGKQTGAACYWGTPGTHPWVIVNYRGTARDASTIAHELGHGVHNYLARNNSLLEYYPGIAIAETASVLGETITNNALMEAASTDEERIALLARELEDNFSTVFRQLSMYRFEQVVWRMHQKKDWLSEEDFNKLWRKSQEPMFGSSITLRPEYDWWWSYIPHFQHTPFYVYGYSFGQLLSLSLYARYRSGEVSADDIIRMLEAGNSQSPQELVTPIGINLADPEFWHSGINIIESRVDEFEDLVS